MTMKLIILLILFLFYNFGVCLDCYTCSVGEQDTDFTCVDNPAALTVTHCNKKYCTIVRQEYLDPKDKVASMVRGCEDKPLHMNEVIEDSSYRIYFRSCEVDLCNGGSGKADEGPNTALGNKDTLIVPGIGSDGSHSTISLILLLVCTLVLSIGL